MVEYLKYIKDYLRHDREKYGVAPFGLAMPFDKKAYYGLIEDDLGISDNNSLYILYNFNRRYLTKPVFKPARDLGNMDDFYYDVLSYIQQLELKEYGSIDVLNEEQRRFFERFLGDSTATYMTESGIFIGESPRGHAYIYTSDQKRH